MISHPKHIWNKQLVAILLLIVLLLPMIGKANEACADETECVPVDTWQVGLAIGVGVKSNPLVDGDNIPLILLPDIAYYGESWYWDNTEVGYQWTASSSFSFETFVSANAERAFFSFADISNILSPSSLGSLALPENGLSSTIDVEMPETINPGDTFPTEPVSVDDIADRDWAVDMGFRLHWLLAQSEWTLSLKTDVSKVHKGNQLRLAYQYFWQLDKLRIKTSVFADWKSSNLIDYYYGVDERDGVLPFSFYDGKAGWQPGVQISLSREINDSWNFIAFASHQRFHKGMYRSPLVHEKHTSSIFVGAVYRF